MSNDKKGKKWSTLAGQTIISRSQGQGKRRAPVLLFQRFFILPVIIWFSPNRLLFHKKKITFSGRQLLDPGSCHSVSNVIEVYYRHLWNMRMMSLNHVAVFHLIFRPVLKYTQKCKCYRKIFIHLLYRLLRNMICFRVTLYQNSSKFKKVQ